MRIQQDSVISGKGTISLFKIINDNGASVGLSSLGAGITSIFVPDKNGKLDDVVLGYKNPSDYFYDGPCAGKVPGRYANRIAKGLFSIDGKSYKLNINNGPNALHGGPEGFSHKIWESKVQDDCVVFSLFSPDGDENYPGNLKVNVAYSWDNDNKLTIRLSASTDKKTIINLTNHSYFNLSGENSGTVLNQKLRLSCSNYLPTDDTLIPTGEISPVQGTPMDFTKSKRLGEDIKENFPALVYGKGYDNCWVVDGWTKGKLKDIAELTDDNSGRVLVVSTTQPAVQAYTGNWLDGSPESVSGSHYKDYDGVAIECQGMPDAPNKPNFPSQILDKDETYNQTIVFQFKTK
jgi:aldose 1-epimerase